MTERGHWSDCAIYNAPALPVGPCNCGGLDLTAYGRYRAVTSLIPTPRSLAAFLSDEAATRLIEPEKLPTDTFAADTSSADLPSPHDGVAILGGADSMNLNETGKSVVSEFQTATGIQCVTSDVPPHKPAPESLSGAFIASKKCGA
jgi:hypothetical protein